LGAEEVLAGLALPEAALSALAYQAELDEDRLRTADGWAAAVHLDDTWVLVRAQGERWEVLAPAGTDPSEAALAARRLHGLLGALAEGWDLDR
jgi:hypothetical protein